MYLCGLKGVLSPRRSLLDREDAWASRVRRRDVRTVSCRGVVPKAL
jgi:hypothetical protein